MKGTSKIIMGATLIMMVSLAMVLALVLVLLAELYCSLLLRRRRHHQATNSTTPTATTTKPTANSSNQTQTHPASLTNIYSHGVLRAPRSLLFPAPSDKHVADIEKPHHSPPTQHLNQANTLNQTSLLLNPHSPSSISFEKTPVLSAAHSNKYMVEIEKTHHSPQNQTLNPTSPTNQYSLLRTRPHSPSTSPQETPFQPIPSLEHLVGIEKTHHSPSNPTSPINQTSPILTHPHAPSSGPLKEKPFQPLPSLAHFNKHLMGVEKIHRSPPPQIFNPTPTQVPFQCESNSTSITDTDSDNLVYISNPIYDNEADTPFETPDTSPSRLGGEGSSGEEGSPAVTPMKKLPADGCSVSLRDLGTSGSEDSNYSKNGGYSSSSASGSPCTSPSW